MAPAAARRSGGQSIGHALLNWEERRTAALAERPPDTVEADRAYFEERAAIREYLGDVPRQQAEIAARVDLRRWVARGRP